MSNRVALTTVDNPFDPFEQFNDWFEFDIEKGYYTCSRLARLTNLSNDMSEAESNKEIEEYQKLTSMEKVKNRRLQNYYRVQLHSQIISSLQNKLSKYDEISNRSRIKNKLLLNDYISTYNNINL